MTSHSLTSRGARHRFLVVTLAADFGRISFCDQKKQAESEKTVDLKGIILNVESGNCRIDLEVAWLAHRIGARMTNYKLGLKKG